MSFVLKTVFLMFLWNAESNLEFMEKFRSSILHERIIYRRNRFDWSSDSVELLLTTRIAL